MKRTVADLWVEFLQGVGRHLGYEIARRPKAHAGCAYQSIAPLSRYCPWNTDQAFLAAYRDAKPHTLVDIFRCYELWQLVEQSSKLQGALIEVGVWRGGTGALIARQARRCGIVDPVYLCDTFSGVVKAGARDGVYDGGEHADTSRVMVENLVFGRLHLDNVRILEGIFPEATAQSIEHEQFRFCHIDVDVYDSARDILSWVWGRLVVGGIVVYDDYGFQGCNGIVTHVEEQRMRQDGLVLYNLNGHAVIVKIK